MPTERVSGFDLHYEIEGDGPTVVFLHGLVRSIAIDAQMGEGMQGLASRGFRVVSYDARGHGESSHTDGAPYTWSTHAEDMCALLDHLGIERAIVGGGSMGAGTSVALALEHPERVEKLVLLAPPPLAGTIGTAQQVFGGLATLIESVGVEKAAEIVVGLPEYTTMKDADPDRYAGMKQWFESLRPDSSVACIRGLLFGPALPEERFAEIGTPTLIVAHPDDPIHPTSTAEMLHRSIAGSQLVMAPTADHYREHREELLDTVATFLKGR